MSSHALLVLTTIGSAADARTLVTSLVEDPLVACGTVLPGAASIYRWEGAVKEESRGRGAASYEVPELLAFPAERGSDLYLSWLTSEVMA